MYAIEKKGWTPGSLDWEVTIPVKGSIIIPDTSKNKILANKKN
jgi:hypothetical protein